MTQKQKGFVGLGVMAVLAGVTIFGSTPLYNAIDSIVAKNISYTPGTYTGSAEGYGGEVSVTVEISESGIDSVKLVGNDETDELGGEALGKMEKRFVEAQSFQVDAVSGSTITSDAAKEAMRLALDQAKQINLAKERTGGHLPVLFTSQKNGEQNEFKQKVGVGGQVWDADRTGIYIQLSGGDDSNPGSHTRN